MLFNDLSIGIFFGFVMSVVYTGLGIFLLIKEDLFNFSVFQKTGLAVLMISYGFFRLFRTLKQKKENAQYGRYEDDEE